jgi:hypothetical protein
MKQCSRIEVHRRFGGMYCFRIQGGKLCQASNEQEEENKYFAYFLIIKKDSASSSETSVRALYAMYFVSSFNFNYA